MINKIRFLPVSRKYGHLLSLNLPERKITTLKAHQEVFKYLSQTRIWFIRIWKRS